MTKEEMIMKHTCRRGGQRIGALEGPAWAKPGEIVKIADQERWGRVALMYRCCHTYDVLVSAYGDDEAGILSLPVDGLENAWAAYPANLPPRGYPMPLPWPGTGEVPFVGRPSSRRR